MSEAPEGALSGALPDSKCDFCAFSPVRPSAHPGVGAPVRKYHHHRRAVDRAPGENPLTEPRGPHAAGGRPQPNR